MKGENTFIQGPVRDDDGKKIQWTVSSDFNGESIKVELTFTWDAMMMAYVQRDDLYVRGSFDEDGFEETYVGRYAKALEQRLTPLVRKYYESRPGWETEMDQGTMILRPDYQTMISAVERDVGSIMNEIFQEIFVAP